eukprot:3609332-Prymnesium_polylepis.1
MAIGRVYTACAWNMSNCRTATLRSSVVKGTDEWNPPLPPVCQKPMKGHTLGFYGQFRPK